MNIIILPYHDWRKIILEGGRTRDAHFIEAFRSLPEVEKVLIINRPYTNLELVLRNKNIEVPGKIVLNKKGKKLLQLDSKTYLADFQLNKSITHAFMGRSWYSRAYGDKQVTSFTTKIINRLQLNNDTLILSQNVFAAPFCQHFTSYPTFFDAWDNFALMPGLLKIKRLLLENYKLYSKISRKWYTNSKQNIDYYSNHYGPANIELLKNGVELERFLKKGTVPDDLKNIPSPIIGFGGKITHLFDSKLFSFLVKNNPNKSFVIVGQVLDKNAFKEIGNHPNLYYLGDKHYDQYPSYVTNFDIGIIPYKTGVNQHGGDSIKAYEYLAAGIKVVGTNDNGIESQGKYVYIAKNKQEFHNAIQTTENNKEPLNLNLHSWHSKASKIIYDFKDSHKLFV